MPMHTINERYLGDGLYASYDGFAIWLRAPRSGGDHYVCLEPIMFEQLIRYAVHVGWTISKVERPKQDRTDDSGSSESVR
jgi:hypothetical protein